METFTQTEIQDYLLLHLREWTFEESSIKRDFTFETFVEAFSFMTTIALEAEKLDHHPDWSNVYNQVSIALSTHSDSGITQRDFDLAGKIDHAFKKYESE